MQDKKLNLVLSAVIIVALLAAGYMAWQRHALESRHRGVAIAVVYDEAASLARMNGLDTVEVLNMFRDRGVSTVLIKEPTFQDARQNGEFAVFTGRELLALGGSGELAQFVEQNRDRLLKKANYRYAVFSDLETLNRVKEQLEAKNVHVERLEGVPVIEIGYDRALLEQVGVGIPAKAKDDVQKAGVYSLVQIHSWNQVTPQGLEYVIGSLREVPNLAGVLFDDPVLPGFPDQIRTLALELGKLDVPIVQIEFNNQVGLARLGLLLDKNVLRLHTVTLEEDAKKNYSPRELVDRFTLAAAERNIRILLAHSYMKPGEPDALETNLQLVEDLRDRLAGEGLIAGEASSLQPLAVSRLVLFVIGLGVIAGGMLLLINAFGWRRPAMYLGLAGLLLWAALLAADMVNPARKLMAFAAVVIFPTLALSLTVRRDGSPPARCVLLLLQTSLLSMVGALLMVGLLADKGFMLKLDQFTGVKLAHLLPLAMVAVIFFFRGDGENGGWRQRLKNFMDQPILVKFAIVAGVLMVALLIYVSRTGNESAAVSPLELKFRALLDNLLGVRPRTKEFLLGHPLLLLLFYLGYRNNSYQPLLLAGVIGQVSLVNTYAHIHTPLLVSLVRSFNGLWLGVLLGLALIVAWRIGERFYQRYFNGTSSG